nr:hypothetical protein [Tanacetum cinerariifolium]
TATVGVRLPRQGVAASGVGGVGSGDRGVVVVRLEAVVRVAEVVSVVVVTWWLPWAVLTEAAVEWGRRSVRESGVKDRVDREAMSLFGVRRKSFPAAAGGGGRRWGER